MNEKVIKLADVEEVCDFVRAAGMCDFDIDISDQRMVIDAKSILGVMGLGIKKELTVKYGGEDITFENVLNKYTVA
ncbi:MAG: HPr family phosphocarrier protein [Lachnospiraceae bacterium]|jgi:phosphocarrier protein HPr|nr:HPr family phosphocarrier protein [Lachnospiraceae bacterium]